MLILAGLEHGEEHRATGHPERPERISAVLDAIAGLDLGDDVRRLPPVPLDHEELDDALARVHAPDYLRTLAALAAQGGGALDPDTYVTAGSWETARAAAGAGLATVSALREAADGVGFVAARPPGHHATEARGMGFCLVNNVAVSASALAAAGERVLIVDWDVHHGNGTQDAYWDDDRVLYASVHQFPAYPGTGGAGEVGGPGARGLTVNVPLPPGATGDVVRAAFDEVLAPAVDRFSPTWVLVSAGFDAHRADPLADLRLSSADFAALARRVARFAPAPGRLVLFLEGGYDLAALASSVRATIGALLDAECPTGAATSGGPGAEAVACAAEIHRRLCN